MLVLHRWFIIRISSSSWYKHRWGSLNVRITLVIKHIDWAFRLILTRTRSQERLLLYKTLFCWSKNSLFAPKFLWYLIHYWFILICSRSWGLNILLLHSIIESHISRSKWNICNISHFSFRVGPSIWNCVSTWSQVRSLYLLYSTAVLESIHSGTKELEALGYFFYFKCRILGLIVVGSWSWSLTVIFVFILVIITIVAINTISRYILLTLRFRWEAILAISSCSIFIVMFLSISMNLRDKYTRRFVLINREYFNLVWIVVARTWLQVLIVWLG